MIITSHPYIGHSAHFRAFTGHDGREHPKRAGLTQNQLAQRLQTHSTSVSAIERGVTGPSAATIERWLDACGFTLRIVPAADAERIDRVLAGGEGAGGAS